MLFYFTEKLEKSFRKQLDECQVNIERLLKEMKDKEKEFEEYCRQVEIDSKYFSLSSSLISNLINLCPFPINR